MNGMTKETLKMHLQNRPLVDAIRKKAETDTVRNRVWDALNVLIDVGTDDQTVDVVREKYTEYTRVKNAYREMIENTWELTWQVVSVIERHIDMEEREVDQLPDYIRF